MKENDASIDVLKFFAIFGVVGIHILGFVEQIDTKRLNWETYITIDQILRFCVPLFVAISGYTLSRKYSDLQVNWKSFFIKRLKRTVPLYLFWSGILLLLARIVPQWGGFSKGASIWNIIFLGQADYHLYFVPMIVCLYISFPIVLFLTKKYKAVFLILTFVFQALLYFWISTNLDFPRQTIRAFYSDSQQYIFFGSWIFYFILGIYLGQRNFDKHNLFKIFFVFLASFGLWWAIDNAQLLYKKEIDVLFATRFTRLPQLVYSTGLVTILILFAKNFLRLPALPVKILAFLGKQSFLIYLCHTIWLRILFGIWKGDLAGETFRIAAVIGILGIAGSIIVEWFFESRTFSGSRGK